MSAIDEIEFLKIQTHVLKVQINCVGCRKKVKKLLKKIEGVYQVSMDVEEQKVTVSGNVDAEIVIMRLVKSGKHAELLSLQELANQEKGSETQYRDGDFQNPELLNGDYHNMELLKWLSDENYQNQVHSQINSVRASKRQPMLPQLYESLGNEKPFKQSMAFESQEGERDKKFSTTMEMDNNPHVHQDYASIVGRKENSMMDSLGPKSNFPYFTTMEGKEHVELAGQQLQYHYPPYNMMNNMQVYQYRNPSPMTVNPYMQRMHAIDNVYMHQPRMVMDHKFDIVPPISYWQNMNMNSYHI
ncbi:heavy metal-associated isoprenylated plant protein 37-like [Ipomoea triloba]|uniref:heavy metal-associated isoprenylated plant protein 37-like n=1 Tax=Ipomoea triloba TaxID=35885 RepID=UPI00125E4C35|nr:heavy metal-associated isoprenylated plant protein 37-like [Ipomoea triloba]